MSLTVMVRTIIFHSKKYRVILDRLRAPYSWLVLDGIEDFIDGEPKWGEVLFRPEGRLPSILVAGVGRILALSVHLLFLIVAFERVVDEILHSLLQLNEGSARDMTSLIHVTSCFSRCLYRG